MTDEPWLSEQGIKELREDLTAGLAVSDRRFDLLYAPDVRRISMLFWTPVMVALRASELLCAHAEDRVLDVGSGTGKFCLVGALTTPGVFVGIERRRPLVDVSRTAADWLDAERALFFLGDAANVDWFHFSGVYFYNPFSEHMLAPEECPDLEHRMNLQEHRRLIRIACAKLVEMPAGTRVATFHGMGGPLPDGYRHVLREQFPAGPLDLYVKESRPFVDVPRSFTLDDGRVSRDG